MSKKGVSPVVKAAAYGGVGAGLILLLLLFASLLPFMEYAIPAACALVIFYISKECGNQPAFACFMASALLGVLMMPNKEAAILYALFFGYYPIFRGFCITHFPKPIQWIMKFGLFNAAILGAYAVLIFVLGLHELWEEINMGIQFGAVFLLLAGNFGFWLFDILLDRAEWLYMAKKMGIPLRFNGILTSALRKFIKK